MAKLDPLPSGEVSRRLPRLSSQPAKRKRAACRRARSTARRLIATQHCGCGRSSPAEWLGDIVVGPSSSPSRVGLVLLAVTMMIGPTIPRAAARKLHAVLPDEAQVEHDEIDRLIGERLRHLGSGRHRGDPQSLS